MHTHSLFTLCWNPCSLHRMLRVEWWKTSGGIWRLRSFWPRGSQRWTWLICLHCLLHSSGLITLPPTPVMLPAEVARGRGGDKAAWNSEPPVWVAQPLQQVSTSKVLECPTTSQRLERKHEEWGVCSSGKILGTSQRVTLAPRKREAFLCVRALAVSGVAWLACVTVGFSLHKSTELGQRSGIQHDLLTRTMRFPNFFPCSSPLA